MTLTELFDSSPDVLEKMNDAELLEVFKESLTVTRPELAVRERKVESTVAQTVMVDPKKAAIFKALAAEGVDMSFLNFKKKKR